MSEEMAEKKKLEIEELEKKEAEMLIESKDDRCPACGSLTSSLIYINPQLIQMFGVVECTNCGCWYSPMSIRKQKLALSKAGIAPANKLVTP